MLKENLQFCLLLDLLVILLVQSVLIRKICHFNGEKKGNQIMGCFFMKKSERELVFKNDNEKKLSKK